MTRPHPYIHTWRRPPGARIVRRSLPWSSSPSNDTKVLDTPSLIIPLLLLLLLLVPPPYMCLVAVGTCSIARWTLRMPLLRG